MNVGDKTRGHFGEQQKTKYDDTLKSKKTHINVHHQPKKYNGVKVSRKVD